MRGDVEQHERQEQQPQRAGWCPPRLSPPHEYASLAAPPRVRCDRTRLPHPPEAALRVPGHQPDGGLERRGRRRPRDAVDAQFGPSGRVPVDVAPAVPHRSPITCAEGRAQSHGQTDQLDVLDDGLVPVLRSEPSFDSASNQNGAPTSARPSRQQPAELARVAPRCGVTLAATISSGCYAPVPVTVDSDRYRRATPGRRGRVLHAPRRFPDGVLARHRLAPVAVVATTASPRGVDVERTPPEPCRR